MWLTEKTNLALYAAATRLGVPIPRVISPRRRDKRVAAVRRHIIEWLRRDVTETNTGEIVERAQTERGDRPLSYPKIAWLLDVDHSAIVHAVKKLKKVSVPEDRTEKEEAMR
ncbi:MAG: hypothetical protein ACE5EX_02750 [Phycisphaerae bacterium]